MAEGLRAPTIDPAVWNSKLPSVSVSIWWPKMFVVHPVVRRDLMLVGKAFEWALKPVLVTMAISSAGYGGRSRVVLSPGQAPLAHSRGRSCEQPLGVARTARAVELDYSDTNDSTSTFLVSQGACTRSLKRMPIFLCQMPVTWTS